MRWIPPRLVVGLALALVVGLTQGTLGCRHGSPEPASNNADTSASSARWRLPIILGGSVTNANFNAWYESAARHQLIGKPVEAAIRVYGEDYVEVRNRNRGEHRLYYRLAGDDQWGIWGMIVLDSARTVLRIGTDPGS
jgi:hypothetical protein